jgi:hypothetical protein
MLAQLSKKPLRTHFSKAGAVARMQQFCDPWENKGDWSPKGWQRMQKKWGLVIANCAIRSPVPRSALFLK